MIILSLLSSLLAAQQITYTSVPNIRDVFDYGHRTFIFNNTVYLMRSRLPPEMFYSRLDNKGIPQQDYICSPKLSYIKYIFYSAQIGSKLFHLGAEEDTIDRRGNILIYNSDLTVRRDSIYYDYPNMEFNICRYDRKRNKILALFSYSIHKDSFNIRRWGIMELDTMGQPLRKKEIPPIQDYQFGENFIITNDGKYLVLCKTGSGVPFFQKLDTNFSVQWYLDLSSTSQKFFTKDFSENLVELPYGKGYCYVGEIKGGKHDNCNFFDSYTSLHFISQSGLLTKNYYHNLINKDCEGSRPKGLFLKNDSTLMIFTQRDTTSDGVITGKDSGSSLVIYYNFNQHRATKEIIGGQLLNDKTSWVLQGDNGICFRTYVGKDVDGGFITSGWANINDNNGGSAYLMKTDSCGYTQDHKCKLVYKIDTLYGNTLKLHIIDSLSVLCQPIWTIEGKTYTNLDITHNFSTLGTHTVKLWGFAGSTVDSLSFQIRVDSMNSSIVAAEINRIVIYPNPASDKITIEYPNNIQFEGEIKMFDLLGRSVEITLLKKDKNVQTFDISKLTEGIYFLKLENVSYKIKVER